MDIILVIMIYIEGTLPVGGLSSSAAVILTYLNAVCIANDIQITRPEIISNAIWAERNYIGTFLKYVSL